MFVARDGGAVICRQPVFEKDEGATDSDLAPLGTGVVVTNNHDYASPRSTLLGFTSSPGIARVDLVDGACVERWISDAVAPGSGVTASRPQRSALRLDQATVAARASARGTSRPSTPTPAAACGASAPAPGCWPAATAPQITLGAGGTAWLGTLAGLVRVRDRELTASQGQVEPDRLLAGLPQPPLRHLVAGERRACRRSAARPLA